MRKEDPHPEKRFKSLGGCLRAVRQRRKESLAEVSGAVEIDIETLLCIEKGEQRPNEEVLLLLISHFSIGDDEAAGLWELADYDNSNFEAIGSAQESFSPVKQLTAFVMPMDVRIVYTDMVNVAVNNYGVTMNFMQNIGPNNQPLAVSRIGMSKEHARSVLEVLRQTLAQAERVNTPKVLPPRTKRQKTDKN